MKITAVKPQQCGILEILSDDGRKGTFDLTPYLKYDAFRSLSEWAEFSSVRNGGYFIEWPCGADLSADTIEAHWSPC